MRSEDDPELLRIFYSDITQVNRLAGYDGELLADLRSARVAEGRAIGLAFSGNSLRLAAQAPEAKKLVGLMIAWV